MGKLHVVEDMHFGHDVSSSFYYEFSSYCWRNSLPTLQCTEVSVLLWVIPSFMEKEHINQKLLSI